MSAIKTLLVALLNDVPRDHLREFDPAILWRKLATKGQVEINKFGLI